LPCAAAAEARTAATTAAVDAAFVIVLVLVQSRFPGAVAASTATPCDRAREIIRYEAVHRIRAGRLRRRIDPRPPRYASSSACRRAVSREVALTREIPAATRPIWRSTDSSSRQGGDGGFYSISNASAG